MMIMCILCTYFIISTILIDLVVPQVAELQEEAPEAAGSVAVPAGPPQRVPLPTPHHRPVRPRQQQGQHQVLPLAPPQGPLKLATKFRGSVVKVRKISSR